MALSALEGFVGYNLKRAYMAIDADFRATLAADALSPRIFAVLALTVENPGITQSDIARLLGIERSGLVNLVDSLEARGLVRRDPVAGDRRVHALCPTAEGAALHARACAAVRAHEARLLAGLRPDERTALIDMLRRIQRAGGEG
jgi:DNA-binding MarR family transcriptional regulator